MARTVEEITEATIHRAIISWLRVVLPEALIWHPANESRRPGHAGNVERAMNVANGVLAGVPDICGRSHEGDWYMEVKAANGRLSPAQRDFRDRLAALGCYRYAVVRSIDDARETLCDWGIQTRESGSLVKLPLRGVVR